MVSTIPSDIVSVDYIKLHLGKNLTKVHYMPDYGLLQGIKMS